MLFVVIIIVFTGIVSLKDYGAEQLKRDEEDWKRIMREDYEYRIKWR